MARVFLVPTAVALVVLSGIIHGIWMDRWGPPPDLEAAAAKLERFPDTVGDWKGRPVTLNPQHIRLARIVGYAARRYQNPRTGTEATVLLVCGRPGHVAAHTPDVCFQGVGYRMAKEPTQFQVSAPSGPPAAFWTALFTKQEVGLPRNLRVFWSWSAAGRWEAPVHSRLHFAPQPALFKLYVIEEMGQAPLPPEQTPCLDLLRQLLPALEPVVGAGAEASRS
jgi:Protein of unknown function (DUF3485)